MMAVATMMLIFVVVVIRTAVRGVVIGMPGIVVVMIVGVYAQGSHVLPHVPLQRSSRRPSELERNDEHDDQGDDAAHSGQFYRLRRICQVFVHTPVLRAS